MEREVLPTQRVCVARIESNALLTSVVSDTSHVPCKFFKQGQCQAGSACPFSHSLDASKFEQPCKYFSKVRRVLRAYTNSWFRSVCVHALTEIRGIASLVRNAPCCTSCRMAAW